MAPWRILFNKFAFFSPFVKAGVRKVWSRPVCFEGKLNREGIEPQSPSHGSAGSFPGRILRVRTCALHISEEIDPPVRLFAPVNSARSGSSASFVRAIFVVWKARHDRNSSIVTVAYIPAKIEQDGRRYVSNLRENHLKMGNVTKKNPECGWTAVGFNESHQWYEMRHACFGFRSSRSGGRVGRMSVLPVRCCLVLNTSVHQI